MILEVADGGEASGGSVTILLAEDEDPARESYRLWFEMEDSWEVREATDGAEALSKLDNTVDVLVLDRHMPELSGSEVVGKLDGTAFTGPVVVVSAYKPDEQLSEKDVDAYLLKPVHNEELVEVIRQLLS